jgi:hypothetical protein
MQLGPVFKGRIGTSSRRADNLAIAPGKHRDLKAELPDAVAHPIYRHRFCADFAHMGPNDRSASSQFASADPISAF